MSKTQIQIVIGLLLTLHLALIMLFAPFGLPAHDNDATAVRVAYLTIGAVLAQPALLAVWAGLAPQPLMRRLAQALALLACADLALDFALVHNRSRNEAADMLQMTASLVAFAVCLSAVWLLRARLKWRIVPPIAPDVAGARDGNQFSMRGMLLATGLVAALFAALRWSHPENVSIDNLWMHLLRFAGFGLFVGLLGLPVLIVCWLVLMRGGRQRLRCFVIVFASCSLAAAATGVARYASPGDFKDLVFVALGMLCCAAPSLWIIRLCGYRLVGLTRDHAPPQDLSGARRSPRLRFASAICSLVLVFAAIASVLPSRLEFWREKAEQRRWADIDFRASLTAGHVTSLTHHSDSAHVIDAGAVRRISASSRLASLVLGPSDAGDKTLASLGELPDLVRLSLVGTRVTDDGLRHLGKFPQLGELDLRATDVSDEGLRALAGLGHLAVVDVSHTRVTRRGVARLKRARPNLRINSTTDDSTLGDVVDIFRPRRTALSRPAGWRPIAVRLHAIGPAVTNAGLAALRGMTNIEELDLTDARVTDAAVGDLGTLSGLKKLTLGGTQISKAGVARLQQLLPACTIER